MIFKIQKRPKRVNGKRVLSKCYYLRYRFGDMLTDRWKSLGVSTLEAAQKLANDFRAEIEAEQAGILMPKPIRDGAKKLIVEHLKDYCADLERRGKTGRNGKGLKQTESRILRISKECGWQYLISISADSFTAWRSRQIGLKSSSLNHYLAEMVTFLNWLERHERIKANPLKFVPKVDENEDDKTIKRAFSDDELIAIFEVAPDYRKIAYHTAAFTGLRFEELQQLQCGDVIFDGENSRIQARASTTKNKKSATLPLLPDLEKALRAYIPETAKPTDKVFRKGVPRSRTLKIDLKKASVPEVDERGHVAVFHSFRKTWATYLHRAGVDERTAMSLMRHSDRRLTNVTYTDTALLPLREAVRSLPQLGEVSHIRAQISGKTGQNVSQHVHKKTPDGVSEVVDCEVSSPPVSRPVEGGQMVEVAGVEPASLVLSYAASTCLALNLLSLLNRL